MYTLLDFLDCSCRSVDENVDLCLRNMCAKIDGLPLTTNTLRDLPLVELYKARMDELRSPEGDSSLSLPLSPLSVLATLQRLESSP